MTDTLLPKNDEELRNSLYALAITFDNEGHAEKPAVLKRINEDIDDIMKLVTARDTKMLEQARLETEIKIHDEYWHSQRAVEKHGIGPLALANKEATELELRNFRRKSK